MLKDVKHSPEFHKPEQCITVLKNHMILGCSIIYLFYCVGFNIINNGAILIHKNNFTIRVTKGKERQLIPWLVFLVKWELALDLQRGSRFLWASQRPVSTQENPPCTIRTVGPKVQTGTENWYRKDRIGNK